VGAVAGVSAAFAWAPPPPPQAAASASSSAALARLLPAPYAASGSARSARIGTPEGSPCAEAPAQGLLPPEAPERAPLPPEALERAPLPPVRQLLLRPTSPPGAPPPPLPWVLDVTLHRIVRAHGAVGGALAAAEQAAGARAQQHSLLLRMRLPAAWGLPPLLSAPAPREAPGAAARADGRPLCRLRAPLPAAAREALAAALCPGAPPEAADCELELLLAAPPAAAGAPAANTLLARGSLALRDVMEEGGALTHAQLPLGASAALLIAWERGAGGGSLLAGVEGGGALRLGATVADVLISVRLCGVPASVVLAQAAGRL